MHSFHVVISSPCLKESVILSCLNTITDILKSLKYPPQYCSLAGFDEIINKVLFLPSRKYQYEWVDLAKSEEENTLDLGNISTNLDNVKLYDIENISERLHEIADTLHLHYYHLNTYWLTCGHAECIESCENIAIHGVLRRLQLWNDASVYLFPKDILGNFKDKWFECFCQPVVTNEGEIKLDNDVIWWGQLGSLYDDKIRDDWRLSILQYSQSFKKETKLFRKTAGESESKLVFNNKINVLYEMKKESLPIWRILPFQFVLYHNNLMKRVLEIKESEDKSFDELFEENENVFMASLALRDQKSEGRTKKDWIKFIMNNEGGNDYENRCGQYENEARHLILYPVEPGIFLAYFLREENIPYIHYPFLASDQSTLASNEKQKLSGLFEDKTERRWLKLISMIKRSRKSPLESAFSLAVQLDANEMLKYFNKDGKPKINNFNNLTTINTERNSIKGKDTDDEKEKVISGVDYCTDSNRSTRIQISPQLLLKHETLSICNTPNRLAKAKLQDVKRNRNKDVSDDVNSKKTIGERKTLQYTSKDTKMKLRAKNSSNKLSKKEETIEAKSKRRSFDGLEIKKDADRREKRSERHKRRLARVVKHALVKYGVKPTDDNFTTCSERLYYVCKSFLQDLKSSERLNEEMKKLAESHVSTVVEFEKRQKEDKS